MAELQILVILLLFDFLMLGMYITMKFADWEQKRTGDQSTISNPVEKVEIVDRVNGDAELVGEWQGVKFYAYKK